jgi:hypothetical protein
MTILAPQKVEKSEVKTKISDTDFDSLYSALSTEEKVFVSSYLETNSLIEAAKIATKIASNSDARKWGLATKAKKKVAAALAAASRDIMPPDVILEKQSRIANSDMGELTTMVEKTRTRSVPKRASDVLAYVRKQLHTLREMEENTNDKTQLQLISEKMFPIRELKLELELKIAMDVNAVHIIREEYIVYEPEIDWQKAERNNATVLVKSIEYDKSGRIKLMLHDAMQAQHFLAKMQGMEPSKKLDLTSNGESFMIKEYHSETADVFKGLIDFGS